ncbi:MAG: translation initiation factor IF-2 subunit alpha [Candidatus Poseidoniaceae archaeon]
MSTDLVYPEEGELVVVSVKSVKQNGADVTLDEYKGVDGFIFIGEIASGWIKNIRRFVREGQRLICKVMPSRMDGSSLKLSLKSVSEERRRDRLQQWKNEQRALQLFKVLGETLKWTEEFSSQLLEELTESYETLYGAFEEAALSEGSLTDAGFEGEWIAPFIEIAVENIIPPFVEIRGTLTLTVETHDGVLTIREALLAAEQLSSEEQEIEVNCFYDGSPEYRIELKAPDFKTAEDTWADAIKATISVIEDAGGTALAYRE